MITPLMVAVMASFGRSTIAAVPRPARRDHHRRRTGRGGGGSGRGTNPRFKRPDAFGHGGRHRPGRRGRCTPTTAWRPSVQRWTASPTAILSCSSGRSGRLLRSGPRAAAAIRAEVVFHKVTQKPGKPLLFARRGPQLVFGLPGNPLACRYNSVSSLRGGGARQLAGQRERGRRRCQADWTAAVKRTACGPSVPAPRRA